LQFSIGTTTAVLLSTCHQTAK